MKIRNKNLLAHQFNAYPYLLCVMTAHAYFPLDGTGDCSPLQGCSPALS